MHFIAEIVMPPVADVEKAVGQVLAQFDENTNERNGFWDWWVIGGRMAGGKTIASLDKDKIAAFNKELSERKVTVSGIQWGKQELSPAYQIPMVDGLWGEFFPELAGTPCPMFLHSNDNRSPLPQDICAVSQVPPAYEFERIIVAMPGMMHDDEYNELGEGMVAQWMLQTSFWNGLTHVDAKWDGTWAQALAMHTDYVNHFYKEEFRASKMIQPNWISVTVDYHS